MIAEKFAELHCLPVNEYAQEKLSELDFTFDTNPGIVSTIRKFLSLLPESLSKSNSCDE